MATGSSNERPGGAAGPLPRGLRRDVLRYGVATALGGIALVVGHELPTLASLKVSFITSYTLLIGLSAWFGGLGPGLLCTVLCGLGVAEWLEPVQSLAIQAPEEIAGTVMFGVVGMGLSLICEQFHRAQRAERAARGAAERAAALERAAKEMRDEMMAMVAHDLRTPLNAIDLGVAAIDRAAGQDPAGDAVRRRVATLHRIVGRMSIMVHDLVDTASLDAGKLTVDATSQPCDALLGETIALFGVEAEARDVRIATDVRAGAQRVLADHDRVLQVLSNLTQNALKFTPRGGSITLGAERVDGQIRFAVHDTGCGLGAEELSHLFERFFRAPRALGGGTGLGLFISKAIVEAHGGTMHAESTEGRGSTFSFTLPAA